MTQITAAQLQVVYRDAHFLAFAKPPGIASTAPDGAPSLFGLARQIDPHAPQLHPLSRLDTQVSGLLVFARDELANRLVLAARRQGRLSRRYLGLTQQAPEPPAGEFRASIGLDPRDAKKRRALPEGTAGVGVKSAHTRYQVRVRSGPIVALDLWPVTGRTHQLRVHAADAGAPLLGDVAYGGTKRVGLTSGRVLSAGRVMLHCAEVSLPHPNPARGELRLSLDVPEDMHRLWCAAGGEIGALNGEPAART